MPRLSIARVVQDVREFHEAITSADPKFGIPECTGAAGLVRAVMRHRLLRQEYHEYQDANLAGNRTEVLDALVDIIYIAVGTALIQFGGARFERAWDAVHRSNMAKRWTDGTFHLLEDGTILKPPDWVAPDIRSIVEGPATAPELDNHGMLTRCLVGRLSEWTDVDVAEYHMGIVLGVLPKPVDGETEGDHFRRLKEVFWTANPLGDAMFGILVKMVETGILEQQPRPGARLVGKAMTINSAVRFVPGWPGWQDSEIP